MGEQLGLRIWGMIKEGFGVHLSRAFGTVMIMVEKGAWGITEFVSEEETEEGTMDAVDIRLGMIQQREGVGIGRQTPARSYAGCKSLPCAETMGRGGDRDG